MKVTVQVVIEAENGTSTMMQEVGKLEREGLQPENLGLKLVEAKDLLQAVQRVLVEEQIRAALAQLASCPQCGAVQRHKDARTIVVRTLFGTLRPPSPRRYRCPCQPAATRTFSPLAELLPERTTPELLYLEAKFAGLASYGLSAKLLAELLPLGRSLQASVVRRHVQATAQRLEDELGPEQAIFIEGCQREWDELPRPELPLTVGLDGGYVHACAQRSKREGWFEVIAGKSMPAQGPARCFGFVQTYDTRPKRRLFELLKSQGMQANQQVTFLTDGGEDVRELPLYLNPQAEHVLDWFHLAMRLTVMGQMAKGLGLGGARRSGERGGSSAPAAQVVPLARQPLPDPPAGRGPGGGPPTRRGRTRAAEAAASAPRVRWLPARQWGLDPELRRTPSQRGDDLERLCRIDDQSGGEQAHGEAAADALDAARDPLAAPGPHTCA